MEMHCIGGDIMNDDDYYEEKYIDLMVNFWVKDYAPIWVKQKIKEELRKQRSELFNDQEKKVVNLE